MDNRPLTTINGWVAKTGEPGGPLVAETIHGVEFEAIITGLGVAVIFAEVSVDSLVGKTCMREF